MNKSDFWKNFSLGTEIEVSGNFIYHGLKIINTIKNFDYPEEVFELLYNISVGFERMMKITILLLSDNKNHEKNVLANKFKNHNLLNLLEEIERNYELNFKKQDRAFLNLLMNFYKKNRYSRFEKDDNNHYQKDKDDFIRFLKKYKKIDNHNINHSIISNFQNDYKVQSFLVSIISKIANKFYELITENARKLNIDTYKLKPNGKAFHIFIYKDYGFENQNRLKMELLIFLLNNKRLDFIKAVKTISPIPFDDYFDGHILIKSIVLDYKLDDYYDLVVDFYEELDDKESRLSILDHIVNH